MNNLIFLISQPRSGSTLLQAILGSHPDVHTSSEPWIALPFVYALRQQGVEFEFNSGWANHGIRAFFSEVGIDEDFYHAALGSFLTSFYQKALSGTDKKVFLDKTPRYYEIASDLAKIFPEAKFIVLYRHPLSVLSSILSTWVKKDTDKLYFFSRDLLAAPHALLDFVSGNKENICLVRYEDIVLSPKEEIERICDYIGINYIEEIINYKSNPAWAFGDKKFLHKKAPDPQSIDAWKKVLPEKLTRNFCYYYLRDLGEDVIHSLGYDFTAANSEILKFKPTEDDFKTWKTLMTGKHIVSTDELRLQAKADLQRNPLKTLLKKLIS